MSKKIKIILITTILLILLGIDNVFAVNGTFSVNKSSETIEIGKTTAFSITATNCGGKFTITSSNNSVATVSSAEEWIENGSKEITITAKSAGTATIKVKADDVASTDEDEVIGSKTITITVPEKKEENNNTNTGTGNNQTSTTPTTKPETPPALATKSSEAKLKNLGIKPDEYDFSGFSKNRNKENWEVTVPNSVTEVTVYGTPLDEKAKVEGTGKVSLKEGNNTAKIKVTAEDGKTTKTYTLTIKRKTAAEEAVENGEARLKNLGIKPEEYDFTGFDSEKTEYSVELPNEIEEVEVYATAKDSKAQITGTGMITLKEGINELPVEVIAVDGTKKVYTLKVTRKESEEIGATTTNTFGLSTLSISGLKLNSKFDVETYEYTVELEEDINSLDIQVEANEENATVEVIGNENLKQGENTIKVLVTNNETQEVVTYQVIVNKNIVQQEKIVQKSWLKPETWGKEEKIKIAIIIVLIILIIWAIILKIKISKESDSKRNVALPGADELDKAIAEHQELSEETNNLEENDTEFKYTSENQDKQNYIEEIAKNRFSINDNSDETPKRRGRHF